MASIYAGEDEMLAVLEVLALADEPMFVIDDRHRIIFWNRPIQRLLGYTHDEVAGRSCASVLAGDDHFGNRYCSDSCPVQLIASRGETVRQFHLRLRPKEGAPLDLEVVIVKFTLRFSKRMLLAHIVRPAAVQAQPAAAIAPAPRPAGAFADVRVMELTARETEILAMLAAGQNPRIIAGRLGISPLTARNHIQHIYEKLEVHSQSEAVAFAYRMQLV